MISNWALLIKSKSTSKNEMSKNNVLLLETEFFAVPNNVFGIFNLIVVNLYAVRIECEADKASFSTPLIFMLN